MALENFEEKIDNKQDEMNDAISSIKYEMKNLEIDISNQDKGVAERLPEDQIDNITIFCEEFLNENDTFVVRARADGFLFSGNGEKLKKEEAKQLSVKLKNKGLVVNPDISTGNTAQAWVRALTLLNQLPEDTLDIIKNKIKFDVKSVPEKDEKGTYRIAALDIKRGTEIIPNIGILDFDKPVFKETPKLDFTEKELNQFESWDELKKPLSIPVLFKMQFTNNKGKKERRYFFKQTQYELKNGKIQSKNSSWRGTNKTNFEHTVKNNSRAIDITKTLDGKYKKQLNDISKINKSEGSKKRFAFLNSITENNPKFAINHFYLNYKQKENGEDYLAKIKEMNQEQKLFASSN